MSCGKVCRNGSFGPSTMRSPWSFVVTRAPFAVPSRSSRLIHTSGNQCACASIAHQGQPGRRVLSLAVIDIINFAAVAPGRGPDRRSDDLPERLGLCVLAQLRE